jgi:hypothetical protein
VVPLGATLGMPSGVAVAMKAGCPFTSAFISSVIFAIPFLRVSNCLSFWSTSQYLHHLVQVYGWRRLRNLPLGCDEKAAAIACSK